MRPNWFIAFPIDGGFVERLAPLPPCFRRFAPADVHMTLAFLGACGEAPARSAMATLAERLECTPLPAFEISLGEVVPMGGSPKGYTALSALLSEGRQVATAALSDHRDALTDAAGVRREGRAPKPHVTLARPQRRATAEQRKAGLAWAAALELGSVRTRADRVALYTWSDDRPRTLFRIVDSVPLGSPAASARST